MMTGIYTHICLSPTSMLSTPGIFEDLYAGNAAELPWSQPLHLHMQTNSQLQHRFPLATFVINREHSMVEFANRAYHNRRLPRPAKEQDSRPSRFPQWQTRTLFTPALSLCPQKVYPWQLLFCRPSRKQNNNIIEGWHPSPSLTCRNMQPITPVWNVTLAPYFHAGGKPLQCSKCIISLFYPETFVKQACLEAPPLNSSSLVNSLLEKSHGLAEAATYLAEWKCQQEKNKKERKARQREMVQLIYFKHHIK